MNRKRGANRVKRFAVQFNPDTNRDEAVQTDSAGNVWDSTKYQTMADGSPRLTPTGKFWKKASE